MNDCEYNKALATSFRILSKKDYSRLEIEKKLIKYEYSPEVIEQVLDKLLQMNFIDDENYASIIIEHYTKRGCGKYKIREELYKRGISSDIMQEKLLEYNTDYDVILNHFETKLQGDISSDKLVEKTKNYLYRKGFSFDEIIEGYLLYKEKLEDG